MSRRALRGVGAYLKKGLSRASPWRTLGPCCHHARVETAGDNWFTDGADIKA